MPASGLGSDVVDHLFPDHRPVVRLTGLRMFEVDRVTSKAPVILSCRSRSCSSGVAE